MTDIQIEFEKTGMLFDKTTQQLTAFPYDFDDIRIKSNEYVTHTAINDSIEKLHYNLMYLYRGCNIGNFDIFDSYLYSISSTSSEEFFKNTYSGYTFSTPGNTKIVNGKYSVLLPYNFSGKSSYLFVAEPGFITCLKTGSEVCEYIFKTDNVDPLSGDIKFKNITDIKSDLYDNLYVVENEYNTIYQYNINNFVSSENIYREKLFLKNLIGGKGGINDNNKFDNIKNIAVSNNLVVAQDTGNKCFKIFDKNLNWINTSVFVEIFDEVIEFEGIILDENNNLYTGTGNKIYKFNFNKDFNAFEFDNIYDLKNYFFDNESITGLYNIPSNKSLFYAQTNRSIKKIWFTSLTYVLGQFNFSDNNANAHINWISVSRYDDDKDLVAVYSILPDNKESLSINQDITYYNTLLNKETFLIYDLSDMYIQPNEYVQSWVLLSKLSKLYYNLFIFLQNIKYKYSEKDGIEYPIIEKKIYNTGFLGFIDSVNYENNFNLGVNEIFQSDVINRALKEIYTFQLTILLYIINNQNNKQYLSPDPYRNLPTSQRYLYFVDESLLLTPNPITLNIFEEISPGAGILKSLGGAPLSTDESISIEEGVNI